MMFLCVTTTPAGDASSRRCTAAAPSSVCGASRRSEGRRRIEVERVDLDHCRRASRAAHAAHEIDSSTTADVVRIAAGEQSRSAPDTRSSCAPNNGTDSGTAMKPASIAPRKPTMYSRPCGARIATRSPGYPHDASSAATTCARRWT